MKVALRNAVTLIAATIGSLTLATSAPALTVQLTRADASPDWTHGSVAGGVSNVTDTTWRVTAAWAYVVPNGVACNAYGPYPAVRIWESANGDQSPSFDIPNVLLNSGGSPQLCLSASIEDIYDPATTSVLVANRLFTVPPAPVTPKPPKAPEPNPAAVTLSRTTAFAHAKSALKARFGRAYRRGKRKRLSCGKRSSTRYRCTFAFRYRNKLRKGIVTVAIKPDGSVSTKIKRRAAHADS
jgi:hypothetical protein